MFESVVALLSLLPCAFPLYLGFVINDYGLTWQEFWKEFFFVVLGIVLGSVFTYVTSRANTKEQRRLFNKLGVDLRNDILNNPKAIINHKELIKLLEDLKNRPIDGGTF